MQRIGFILIIASAQIITMLVDGKIFRNFFGSSGFALPYDLNCFVVNGGFAAEHFTSVMVGNGQTCAFMYPPPFLLIAAPFYWLPPFWTYVLWVTMSAGCLGLADWAVGLPLRVIALGIASPPGLLCLTIGQTGMIVSALLLASLGLAETNPIMAGVAAGFLIIKPQFSVLIPVCFLASRNWRAFGAAAAVVVILAALSSACFGLDVWKHFFDSQMMLAKRVLDAVWPQPFQHIMVSVFITMRSFGASVRIANAAQAVTTVVAIGTCCWAWSRGGGLARLLLTFALIALSTPYGYVYDLPGLALLMAGYTFTRQSQSFLPMALFWVVTSIYILLSMVSISTGAILLILIAIYVLLDGKMLRNAHFGLDG